MTNKEEVLMTKSDLKNRMLVRAKCGSLYMVVDGFLVKESGWFSLNCYNEDLTIKRDVRVKGCINLEDYDITKVYSVAKSFNTNECELLWERPEVKELTIQEIEDKLGYKVKIVGEKLK